MKYSRYLSGLTEKIFLDYVGDTRRWSVFVDDKGEEKTGFTYPGQPAVYVRRFFGDIDFLNIRYGIEDAFIGLLLHELTHHVQNVEIVEALLEQEGIKYSHRALNLLLDIHCEAWCIRHKPFYEPYLYASRRLFHEEAIKRMTPEEIHESQYIPKSTERHWKHRFLEWVRFSNMPEETPMWADASYIENEVWRFQESLRILHASQTIGALPELILAILTQMQDEVSDGIEWQLKEGDTNAVGISGGKVIDLGLPIITMPKFPYTMEEQRKAAQIRLSLNARAPKPEFGARDLSLKKAVDGNPYPFVGTIPGKQLGEGKRGVILAVDSSTSMGIDDERPWKTASHVTRILACALERKKIEHKIFTFQRGLWRIRSGEELPASYESIYTATGRKDGMTSFDWVPNLHMEHNDWTLIMVTDGNSLAVNNPNAATAVMIRVEAERAYNHSSGFGTIIDCDWTTLLTAMIQALPKGL